MKKIISFGFALLLLNSFCSKNNETSGMMSITGSIKNYDGFQLRIFDFFGKKAEQSEQIVINEDSFSYTIDLGEPVIKHLLYGSTMKSIYLEPGHSLKITFDTKNIDTSISYEGSLGFENAVLDSVTTKIRDQDYIKYLFRQSLDVVTASVDSLYTSSIVYFNNLISEKNTSSIYREYMSAVIEYHCAGLKIIFGERHDRQPDHYYDFLNQLSIENTRYMDIPEYRLFLTEYLQMNANHSSDTMDSDEEQTTNVSSDNYLKAIETLKNDTIRAYSLFNAMVMRLNENGINEFNEYYDYFKAHNTEPHYADEIRLAFEKKQFLAPGQPAPKFTLNDVNGNKVSLGDFKGKYVYIDFWQTLCPNSARELPHYLKLQGDYANENIAFVSISIDVDADKWRNYVQQKKNVGTSLRTEGLWDSEDYNAYQVDGLPSFILIDPEGKIIDPVAAKPSSKEIRETFDQLLKSK